ncbi:MAG: tetratricopeptide repeat protein [Magnetococcales bacterium]|nr:tetratricopeptide repeat protein [Magnetococcales bacterium]
MTRTGNWHTFIISTLLTFSILLALPAQSSDDLSALADQALEQGDAHKALTHLLSALEQDPDNSDLLRKAALISMQSSEQKQSASLLKRAIDNAVSRNNPADVAFFGERLSMILSAIPAEAEEQLNQASALPDSAEAAKAAGEWQQNMDQVNILLQTNAYEEALALAQENSSLAENAFGSSHIATLNSLRDLATLYHMFGQLEPAEQTLSKAINGAETGLGPGHPHTLELRSIMAELYESATQFDRAREEMVAILPLYEENLGQTHPQTLNTHLSIARMLQNTGKDKQAESIFQGVCEQLTTVFGLYHANTAECYQFLALSQSRQGHYDQADTTFSKTLDIQKAIYSANDPNVLITRTIRADLHRSLGRYEQARDALKEVIELVTSSPEIGPTILNDARAYLAQVYEDMGSFKRAEELIRLTLAHETNQLGREHPNTITTLTSLAGVLRRQAHFLEAEAAYVEALDLCKKYLGENHLTTITVMNNLGLVYENQGLYDKAEPLFKNAVSLGRSTLGETHPTTMASMNSLALLHESQGNFDKAEPWYQNAIAFFSQQFGESHPDTIAIINNLAYLNMLQQDFESAAPRFEKVYQIWRDHLGDRHQKTLKGMNNLARVYHSMGKLVEAETLFQRAMNLRRTVLGPEHMDTLRSMHDMASLLRTLKRLDEAERLLVETLEKDEKALGDQHPYTFETLSSLADVKEDKKRLHEAFTLRKIGFSRRTKFLNRMLWVTGDNAREGYIRLHRPELNKYISLIQRMNHPYSGWELLDVSLQRKGLLLKISSEIMQIVRFASDPTLAVLAEQLTSARKKLASLTLSGPTADSQDNHLDILHDLELKIDDLERQLGQASIRYRELVTPATVDDLINQVPVDAALVDFLQFQEPESDEQRLVASIMFKTNEGPVFKVVYYNNIEEIEESIVEFRTIIQDEDADLDEINEMGQWVYEKIWQPLAPHLNDRQQVFLVPDGMLNILPFNAMMDEEEEYLIEKLDLHILTSVRDLLPSSIPVARGVFTTIAGPDYDSRKVAGEKTLVEAEGRRSASSVKMGLRALSSGMRGLKFDPLPGAEKEGRLIVKESTDLNRINTLFSKLDAQEKVFRSMEEPPEVLHIATHGFFLKADENLKRRLLKLQRGANLQLPPPGDNPLLRAGLAFAGINTNAQFLGDIDTDNDGVLTALEVLGLNLSGTRLAVLSACETGLGEIHEGEGVYGLRRSFQEAGVSSVISSLWEVSDAGTQTMMTGLYKRLLKGETAHKALRAVQLEMIQSDEWEMPYIWSAFMIVGRES